ncbi:hypothetical protein O0I10_000067 [Lichtheimia ornata]|uniref:Uncharacterized protein n=1 Tax=Lichtheimia ornata TaxID=688661 RepID=A0AAD7Y4R9_9FUNG|nr:uncharacterized protein O0I10_000067 [Lichtheimia ornata]KAJ8663793.1 hypothetical protein O0I10_000067 [Lichtheimia ornata]
MAERCLQDTDQWCIKFCALLHWTIGQPARGSEFTSTTYERHYLSAGQHFERSMALLNYCDDDDNGDDEGEQHFDGQHVLQEMHPKCRLANTTHSTCLHKSHQTSLNSFHHTSLFWHSIIDILDAPRMQQHQQDNTRPSNRANSLCADYITRDAATRVGAQLVPVIGSIQRVANAYTTAVDITTQMAGKMATHTVKMATWMQTSNEKNTATHQQL